MSNTPENRMFCIFGDHSKASKRIELNIEKAKLVKLQTNLANAEKAKTPEKTLKALEKEVSITKVDVEYLANKLEKERWIPITKHMLNSLIFKEKALIATLKAEIKVAETAKNTTKVNTLKKSLDTTERSLKAYNAHLKTEAGDHYICEGCFQQAANILGIASDEDNNASLSTKKDKQKTVTFADVAGAEDAKAHAQELVEYLKDPTRLSRLGGKVPSGAIFKGPPGTGKTLMAKAIAGEADVPFFSYAGSEFVNKYVGIGADNVRKMFDEARENAPCIIFIDEIDALASSRESGGDGGSKEESKTLNQLLVEMDGFEGNEGIMILAATNRIDTLDPAVLRPGRFDRHIQVDLPHKKAREAILEIHTRDKPLADDVKLSDIAFRTRGFSGADLANLMNESALRAAKQDGKESIEHVDVDEAFEKIIMGAKNTGMILTDEQREETAWHEAGHAIIGHIGYLLEGKLHDPVNMVTILPRGNSLGATWYQPEGERVGHSKDYLLDQIDSLNGGRIGELLLHGGDTGKVSTGASSDVSRATDIALNMARKWLFGKCQLVEKTNSLGSSNLDDASRAKHIHQAEKWITDSYARTEYYLTKHKDILKKMVNALLAEDTIRTEEISELFKPLDIYKGVTMKKYMEESEKKTKTAK